MTARCSIFACSAALHFACVETRDAPLPAFDSAGTKSLIAAVRAPELELTAYVFDSAFTLSAPPGANVTLIFFARTLEELQLEPGRIERFEGEGGGRPIPAWIAAYDARLDPDRAVEWMKREELGEDLEAVRISDFDFLRCHEQGGCVRSGACVLTCPIEAPMPPEDAELPREFECDVGWERAELSPQFAGDFEICVPSTLNCGALETHFLGDAGCTPVAGECSAGKYPDDLPPGAPIIYVSPAAPAPGSGTIQDPFRDLTDALEAAHDGDIIALARGNYLAPPQIPISVELAGACGAETIIEPRLPNLRATIHVQAADVKIRGVTVRGALEAIRVDPNGALELEDALVERATEWAVYVDHGFASIRRTVVRGPSSQGINVAFGEAIMDQAAVEHFAGDGMIVIGENARATLDRVHLRDTRENGPSAGIGLAVRSHAGLVLRRSVVEDVQTTAIQAIVSANATISQVLVRDVAATNDGTFGQAFTISGGTIATVEDTTIERSRGRAFVIGDPGTRIFARDIVAHCILPERDAPGADAKGHGIEMNNDAYLDLGRFYSVGALGHAVRIAERAQADLTDLTLEGGCTDGLRADEPALSVAHQATVDAKRVSIRNVDADGIQVQDVASSAYVEDVTVVNARFGVHVFGPVNLSETAITFEAKRLRLERTADAAVSIAGFVTARLEDLRATNAAMPDTGDGLAIEARAAVSIERAELGSFATGFSCISNAQIDFRSTGVANNAIGASTDRASSELFPLFEGAVYTGNRTLLDRL